jgi:hypothetical protein
VQEAACSQARSSSAIKQFSGSEDEGKQAKKHDLTRNLKDQKLEENIYQK